MKLQRYVSATKGWLLGEEKKRRNWWGCNEISSAPTGSVWKRERGTKVASSGCNGKKHEPFRSLQMLNPHPHSNGE
jgi:hypothetical protein